MNDKEIEKTIALKTQRALQSKTRGCTISNSKTDIMLIDYKTNKYEKTLHFASNANPDLSGSFPQM